MKRSASPERIPLPRWVFSRAGFILGLLLTSASIAAAAPLQAPPLLSVSVNDSRLPEVFRGMPMLVSVVLMHPAVFNSNAEPILISGASGPWTSAVHIDVTDQSGTPQSWPFHSGASPSNVVVLDGTRFAQMHRWLTPAETSMLSTGQYTLAPVLNTTNVTLPGVWQGTVESVPAEVTILDEPSTLSEAQAENKYSQLALYQLFLGNGEAGLTHVNQLLGSFPTNITGMRLKGILLDALGRTSEAYSAVGTALAEVYARNPDPQEPPTNLLELQRRLEAKLSLAVLAYIPANDRLVLSWFAYPGLSYRLETSSNLAGWSVLTTNFTVVDNIASFTIPLAGDRRFFRVAH